MKREPLVEERVLRGPDLGCDAPAVTGHVGLYGMEFAKAWSLRPVTAGRPAIAFTRDCAIRLNGVRLGVIASASGAVGIFGFTGEQFDPETGFTFLRACYLGAQSSRRCSLSPPSPSNTGWRWSSGRPRATCIFP